MVTWVCGCWNGLGDIQGKAPSHASPDQPNQGLYNNRDKSYDKKLETVDIKVTYEKMKLQPKENLVNL